MPLVLTPENYYSDQANKDYMSVSLFKDFVGTQAHTACELAALQRANGNISQEPTTSLLVGSYIDAYFEGTLDDFIHDNMDFLCTKASVKRYLEGNGQLELLSDFRKAEAIIERVKQDPLFMSFTAGEKQRIMTADLFGILWKIKMDFYFDGEKIVDLKVMKDAKPIWSPLMNQKVDFIHYWGYDIQGAIYQKVVEKVTGKKLPFYIAYITKEDVTDYNIVEVTQPHLDKAFTFVGENIEHVLMVRNGLIPPSACHTCAYCRQTKRLTGPIVIDELMPMAAREIFSEETSSFNGPVDLFN